MTAPKTNMLDLPDDLLLRCLAGAGAQAIAAAAVSCARLRDCSRHLVHLPVWASAMATDSSLQAAISNATQRALSGCFGRVDMALLFVANHGSAKTKKYSDPADISHAADMLREALGQDVPILGCACAGVMGIGPDGAPLEVDPACATTWFRAVLAARKRAQQPPPPTKGVALLLGKLPAGCVVRGLAIKHAPANVVGPHSWEEVLGEALALTSSQQAQLSHQLAAMQPDAAVNANAGNGAVRLVPSLAYMVHGELGKAQAMVSDACKLLAARGVRVVGGQASGAGGDLIYAPGAEGCRLGAEARQDPVFAMLLVCTAEASTAALTPASAAATASGAAPAPAQAPAATPTCSSHSALATGALSVLGSGPARGCSLYADVSAALRHVVSSFQGLDHFRGRITACRRVHTGTASRSRDAGTPQRQSQRLAAPAVGSGHAALMQLGADLEEGRCARSHPREGVYAAFWRVPHGSNPAPFTCSEAKFVVADVTADVDSGSNTDSLSIVVSMYIPTSDMAAFQDLLDDTSGSLCMQVVDVTGDGSECCMRTGLARMLPAECGADTTAAPAAAAAAGAASAAAAAAATAAAAQAAEAPASAAAAEAARAPAASDAASSISHTRDYYVALSQSARAAGARSGLASVAVFSCVERGQVLYARDCHGALDARAFGARTEAGIVDGVCGRSVPMVGVFVNGEVGPPIAHACLGASMPDAPAKESMEHAYTSMCAVVRCQPR